MDLRQRTVAASGIVAVVCGPGVGGRLEQFRRVELLRRCESRGNHQQRESPRLHFKVSKYARMLCMSASEYCFNRSKCSCNGSCTATFTPVPSSDQERYSPLESFSATLKSSRYCSAPAYVWPDGSVTVTVVCARGCGGGAGMPGKPLVTG